MAKKQKGTFGVKVSGGNAAGFSNIPGASSYTVALGKQFAKKFGEGVKSVGTKPKKPKDQVIQDPPKPDSDGEPTKPKEVKAKKATTADVERAVAGGFITPEEATGGEWGKDAGLSTTYSKKYAANTAANDGKAKGKKFTGPAGSQGRETAAIWDTPSTSSVGQQFTPPPVDLRDIK
jgi:hypothetical protein